MLWSDLQLKHACISVGQGKSSNKLQIEDNML